MPNIEGTSEIVLTVWAKILLNIIKSSKHLQYFPPKHASNIQYHNNIIQSEAISYTQMYISVYREVKATLTH